MNTLLRKKPKYNFILFFIALLFVSCFVFFDIIAYDIKPSKPGKDYPFEKAERWVSLDPYFVLEYKYVDGELLQNTFLEINGELQEVEVGHQGGVFAVFLKTSESENHNGTLFSGTWKYRGDDLVYYIDDDFVFDGAYKEIVFEPKEIVDQEIQPELLYEMDRGNIITYDYDVYFRQNCIVPLCLALFCLIFFISFLVSILKEGGKPAPPLKKAISYIPFILIPLCLMIINLFPLFRGGIHLLYEKETDQIQVSGKIEETMEIDSYTGAKYDTENNHGNGEIIVVNGEKYYLTTYGDFGVGDDVVLNVLPRSGFVLEMQRANSTSGSETNNG